MELIVSDFGNSAPNLAPKRKELKAKKGSFVQKTKPITQESVSYRIQKQRQKLVQKPQPPKLEAQSDVQDFLNKNKKHHLKVKNEDEEFDLEDPSEYEKEAENYTVDTLDAYSSAITKHSLAEESISSIVSD